MILSDSNIFIIDRFFKRDVHYEVNKRFVEKMLELDVGISIYNLLEICGIASFNLSPSELEQWFYRFDELYRVRILYPKNLERTIEQYFKDLTEEIFRLFSKKMTFVDAQILLTAEKYGVSHLVTWNIKDFEGRTHIPVLTPEEFLEEYSEVKV
ncbi:MAG: hypothetical protein U9M97_05070 [Candidatus Hadarchaeota archaeon]|nr:hypothetical protein [Candidatus Hadarchaeota archaeon]